MVHKSTIIKAFLILTIITGLFYFRRQGNAIDQDMIGKEEKMGLVLTTNAFQDGEWIPVKFTCDGEDVSPALEWENPPEGTQCFALICDDPDAPMGTWVHWVFYNLPPNLNNLREGINLMSKNAEDFFKKAGDEFGAVKQGINSWSRYGYGGPCPPPGGPHRYFFKLFALDIQITEQGLTSEQLTESMAGHILDQAQIMGKYQRK